MGRKLNFKLNPWLIGGVLVLIVVISAVVYFVNHNPSKKNEETIKQYQAKVNDIDKTLSEGKKDEALALLDQQIKKTESENRQDWNEYFWYHKAGVYLQDKKYDRAIEIYEQMAKRAKDDEGKGKAYYSLFTTSFLANKPEEVVIGYKKSALEYMNKVPEKFSRQLFNLKESVGGSNEEN